MTARERVLAAVGHRQPDRVPVAMPISGRLRERLAVHLGTDGPGVDRWIGNDLVSHRPRFKQPASPICYADPTIEVTSDDCYLDIWRVPFRAVETGGERYVELAGRPPLAACGSARELDAFPWPDPDAWDYSGIATTLDALSPAGPGGAAAPVPQWQVKAIWGHSRGFFEIAHFLRGMDNFMVDLATDPGFAGSLMDHILEYLLERTWRILTAGAGRFTVFEYNDDVGSQRGLFISPAMWRDLIKPRMARMCGLIHEHGVLVRYHSCGSVRPIIGDLIEIGVDILNPIQPLAKGMDPFELKREFGDLLTFHGGIDIQELLPRASAEQVRAHVRRVIDEVGRDGGYILGGSHNLQADTPVENVVAMIEEARRGARTS